MRPLTQAIVLSHLAVCCAFVELGCIVLLGVFSMVSLREGSFLYRTLGSTLIFRKRWTFRASMFLLGILVALAGPFSYWSSFSQYQKNHSEVVTPDLWFALGAITLICLILGTVFLHHAGAEELRFDVDQRSYCIVSRWLFQRRLQSGSWEDIAAVYVQNANSMYFVGVVWRASQRKTQMGVFNRLKRANHFAEELSTTLALPRVML